MQFTFVSLVLRSRKTALFQQKRKQAVEDLDPKVFGVIMGSVSPESLTEIKYHTDFKTCRDADDWTALLKIIKDTHLSTHGQSATEHQKMQAKVEHLAAFFAMKQGDHSLNVYRERFDDAVQMLKNSDCPALQQGQEVYTFCINLDKRRYEHLQVMWQNGEVLGTNKYPDTVQAAHTIARNTVTTGGSGRPKDAKMVMAIETRISSLENANSKRSGDRGAGRAPRDAKRPTGDDKERARKRVEYLADKPCYSCGIVGNHLASDCPNYNKLLPHKPPLMGAISKPTTDRPRRQVSFIAAADPTGDDGGDVWREVAGDEDTTGAVNDMLADIELDDLPDLDCDHYNCYMVTSRELTNDSTATRDHAHSPMDCSEHDDAVHMTTWDSDCDDDSDGDSIPTLSTPTWVTREASVVIPTHPQWLADPSCAASFPWLHRIAKEKRQREQQTLKDSVILSAARARNRAAYLATTAAQLARTTLVLSIFPRDPDAEHSPIANSLRHHMATLRLRGGDDSTIEEPDDEDA